ncbi:MAG: class IV adenylate cyclase [Candidatus Eisenbacteria bacterium]|nr:class IV adenylate cyclase [Candidatus Eisenbacteria bacterium]
MATNIEIKAIVRDAERFRAAARKVSDSDETIMEQEDVFFDSPGGRLKLRLLSPSSGQLIYYERPDNAGPRPSDYFLFETPRPDSLLEVLGKALAVRGRVKKTRSLYMSGAARIHLDEVEGLGTFAEIEVVLVPGQSAQEGASIADHLMKKLGIQRGDLVAGAYIDLLEARREGTG